MSVYELVRGNNYTLAAEGVPWVHGGLLCSVLANADGTIRLKTSEPVYESVEEFPSVLGVLRGWGQMWMWKDLRHEGDLEWIGVAIQKGSLLAVTDGSFIRDRFPQVCSAGFILECTETRRRVIGAFPEQSGAANAYRGELLGLLAVHLLLKAVDTVRPEIGGSVDIWSDCLGALGRVAELPPKKIPTRCRHSDILKTILVRCDDVSFARTYSHVKAHQDDAEEWDALDRTAQLNCYCDAEAKRAILSLDELNLPAQQAFPLEPVSLFVGGQKMTSDTGPLIRAAANKELARAFYHEHGVLTADRFDLVDWSHVGRTLLSEVPKLFQLWACKQVMGIAATNKALHQRDSSHCPMCPCCAIAEETTAHVLQCEEAGRVEAFHLTADCLEGWMEDHDTQEELAECLGQYVHGRGSEALSDICRGMGGRFRNLGRSQDKVGWRRFLEGMVVKEVALIQREHLCAVGSSISVGRWMTGFIVKLLEITHGQWIYRNLKVHDEVAGELVTKRKEELQLEIERQMELGEDGLLRADMFLADVNLSDLEHSSGERQMYWLLAIKTARKARWLHEGRPRRSDDND